MANYFSRKELECKCCGVCLISDELLGRLNHAREIAGIPFILNSAYRCEKHNDAVGGSPTSSHVIGKAVDIRITNNNQRFIILNALLKAGFTRLGVGKSFIHVDCDEKKAQNVIWTY